MTSQLDRHDSSTSAYQGPPSQRVVVPFHLSHDPVDRILLADFKHDTMFHGFEMQAYDDLEVGRGLVVQMFRNDGKVDWHMTPGLALDRSMASVGAGVGVWETQDFAQHLAIGRYGVVAALDLTLSDGRTLSFEVLEHRDRGVGGIDMLAPVGAEMEDPQFFPLYPLYGLDFVQRSDTNVRCRIYDVDVALKRFPMFVPYSGRRSYLMRYCDGPLNIRVNTAQREPVALVPGPLVETDGARYAFTDRGGYWELAEIAIFAQRHEAWMALDPPLPDLAAIRDGTRLDGRFGLGVDHEEFVAGRYHVHRRGDRVSLGVDRFEQWRPSGPPLTRLTVGMFPRHFKAWPTTYRWAAELDLGPESTTTSSWSRTNV